ncbi:nitrous oxide reductase accessory protein NosL [Brumimicrobium oceani]|uniref:Copper chaperone NosL n=1 Tax=Brumimicrobium oceani TaxID=2100725 RepID=A0A2U2X0J8_9FLAO|nr:nitrous oxide reductase accessory protein NosL [Brumimicrobium oceani]PWH81316.1 hypothetical protein DIT68_15385 [Brumimicrobium oceani]
MKKLILFVLLSLVFVACSIEAKPINYGTDACDFCKMSIVDQIHGAEIVTDKGKVYKFDAIECMINFKNEMSKEQPQLFLTNHYHTPKELIDAENATFLISENLPSPMGEFITAFASKEAAEKIHQELDGKLYNWKELVQQQSNK